MNDFESQVLKSLETINNGLIVNFIVLLLLFLICLGALFIYSSEVDKKNAKRKEKEIKDYIDQEINNAKK